jgi:hypothetical protein
LCFFSSSISVIPDYEHLTTPMYFLGLYFVNNLHFDFLVFFLLFVFETLDLSIEQQ